LCKPNWNAQGSAHRFAFSVARALRQAMLRVSFRLAPCFTTRPLDLPVLKTRDTSNRLLPLERRFVYPYSRVPGSLPRLAPCGCFPDFGIQKALTEERDVSRRPPSLRRIAFRHTFFFAPRPSTQRLRIRAWAFFFPRCSVRSTSDTPVATSSRL
jgi:hypothetical protein